MIKINLLPQNGQRGPTRGAPRVGNGSMVLVMSIALMVALNGAGLWWATRSVMAAKHEMTAIQAKHDQVKKQIDENMDQAEQVRQYREVVNNQMDVLKSLDPPERILWCEKLNMLANLIPPDVFLSEVAITEQVEMVETEASKAARLKWEKSDKKQGKEPQPVKRPIISYQMKITGLGLGRDNVEQFNNVMKFQHALAAYSVKGAGGKEQRFMDGFNPNIDFGSIEATLYEGTPVNQFVFTLRTKVMGLEDPEKSADGAAASRIASADDPARNTISSRRAAVQATME